MFEYYALFIFITLLGPLNSIYLMKKYQLATGTSLKSNVLYCFINGVVSAVVPAIVMAVRGVPFQITPYSVLMALGLVISSAVNTVAFFKAYEKGQIAVVNIFSTVGNIIFSCLWGVIVLGEKLSVTGLVAIIMMLSSVILIQPKVTNQKSDLKLLWLYAIIILSSSATSILSKQHQVETSFATVDTLSFSVWVGALRAIVFAVITPFMMMSKKHNKQIVVSKKPIFYAVASSVVSGGSYIISLFTSKMLPIVITSPLSTGLGILMSTALPWMLFHEKLSRRQIVAAGLSLVGAVMFVIG